MMRLVLCLSKKVAKALEEEKEKEDIIFYCIISSILITKFSIELKAIHTYCTLQYL
jgi:hypothetical protein